MPAGFSPPLFSVFVYMGTAIPNALQQLSLITILPKLVPRSFVVVKEVNRKALI